MTTKERIEHTQIQPRQFRKRKKTDEEKGGKQRDFKPAKIKRKRSKAIQDLTTGAMVVKTKLPSNTSSLRTEKRTEKSGKNERNTRWMKRGRRGSTLTLEQVFFHGFGGGGGGGGGVGGWVFVWGEGQEGGGNNLFGSWS